MVFHRIKSLNQILCDLVFLLIVLFTQILKLVNTIQLNWIILWVEYIFQYSCKPTFLLKLLQILISLQLFHLLLLFLILQPCLLGYFTILLLLLKFSIKHDQLEQLLLHLWITHFSKIRIQILPNLLIQNLLINSIIPLTWSRMRMLGSLNISWLHLPGSFIISILISPRTILCHWNILLSIFNIQILCKLLIIILLILLLSLCWVSSGGGCLCGSASLNPTQLLLSGGEILEWE